MQARSCSDNNQHSNTIEQITMKKKETRLTILDSLRGLAAVGVIFFWHYQVFIGEGEKNISSYPFVQIFHWFYSYGWILVDLFFVLSGFVLCHAHNNRILKNKEKFKNYLLHRIARLYPLTIFTTLFVFVIQRVRLIGGFGYTTHLHNDFMHLVINTFLLQGIFSKNYSLNGPSWTISILILLYILFFVCIKFFYKKRFIFYASMIAIGFSLTGFKDYMFHFHFISRGLIAFFIGCFTYEIYKYASDSKKKNILILTCFINIIFIIFATFFVPSNAKLMASVFVILFFPSIILLSLYSRIIIFLFDRKIFNQIGYISFSMYLIHFPLQLLIITLNDFYHLNIQYKSPYFFLFFFFFTVTVSYLVYNFFEKKVQSCTRLYLNK